MIVLGIDPGATTGFAVFEQRKDRSVLHAWSGRLERFSHELTGAFKTWKPTRIVVEGWELMGPAMMRGACHQAWMSGLLVGWLRGQGKKPVVLTRTQVKQAMYLKRNASKDQVRAALSAVVENVSRCSNDHELDAAALAYALCRQPSVTKRKARSVKDAPRRG